MDYILNMNAGVFINIVCVGSFAVSIPVWYFWQRITKNIRNKR